MTLTEIIILSLDGMLAVTFAGLIIFARSLKEPVITQPPKDLDWLLSKGDIPKLNKSIPVEGCRGNT